MKIVKTPAKVLTKKAEPVKKFDKKLAFLVGKMTETLKSARNPEGVGLAAPQVGVLKRIFIMQVNAGKKCGKPRYKAFINPEITEKSGALYEGSSSALKKGEKPNSLKKLPDSPDSPDLPNTPRSLSSNHRAEGSVLEGCLSIENVWGFPRRSEWVKLRYQDLSGKKRTQKFAGFSAVIVQHEIDHLDGVLFTRKVLKQKGKLYKIEKDKKTKEPALVALDL